MTEQKIEVLVEKFIRAAKNHYVASLAGDWIIANREAKTIRKTIKKIKDLGENAREALLVQTESKDLAVSAMAAVYSLNYAPEESISVLTRIAKEPGLIGFEADQALQRWKEGEWNLEE